MNMMIMSAHDRATMSAFARVLEIGLFSIWLRQLTVLSFS
jgi:hypothetical protein